MREYIKIHVKCPKCGEVLEKSRYASRGRCITHWRIRPYKAYKEKRRLPMRSVIVGAFYAPDPVQRLDYYQRRCGYAH